jgi:hypothetical protein
MPLTVDEMADRPGVPAQGPLQPPAGQHIGLIDFAVPAQEAQCLARDPRPPAAAGHDGALAVPVRQVERQLVVPGVRPEPGYGVGQIKNFHGTSGRQPF